jgi:long-subunit fatty acid transport protein
LDVVWYDWSHAFDRLDMRLTNPSNPLVAALAGPVLTDSLPMNWRDTVSLRLGYEWDTRPAVTWRGGYVYHASPVPNSTLNPYLDGVLEHAFSIGRSRQWRRATLNAAYQYSWSPERHVVGPSSIIGGDFDNSTFRAQAHWIAVSMSVPF